MKHFHRRFVRVEILLILNEYLVVLLIWDNLRHCSTKLIQLCRFAKGYHSHCIAGRANIFSVNI